VPHAGINAMDAVQASNVSASVATPAIRRSGRDRIPVAR
jgi:hypothetical protein